MNKKTVALTKEQYQTIIDTTNKGFTGCRPNNRIATALMIEANLGLRIGDILNLRLCDIIKDGNRFRLNIKEEKTDKNRHFTVVPEIYEFIKAYTTKNGIKEDEKIFPITERAVQKHLGVVCDYLGYKGISTHSFRKFYATNIYEQNDYNVVLVQELLQHSSPSVTQRYIGIGQKALENAIKGHLCLVW